MVWSHNKGGAMDLKILDKASQLAKLWVKNMSGGENIDGEDVDEVEIKRDGRPARLGLGAEFVPHSQLTDTLNPLEKKLKRKLDVSKGAQGQHSKPHKTDLAPSKSKSATRLNEVIDCEDDGGRASQFSRKQKSTTPNIYLGEPLKGKKKRRRCG